MTILDNDRGYARPVEEVARAVAGHLRGSMARRNAGSELIAVAAIGKLRELGFINDIGLEAIKAEASSNARDLLTAQAQDQGLYDTTGGGE